MSNWYLESGKESDVVISTRIRLARNLDKIPFPNRMSRKEAEYVLEQLKQAIEKIGYGLKFFRLSDMDDITKLALVEKHIISPDFALNTNETHGIAINDEENIAIMINEEDHIRIQILSAGLELEYLLGLAIEIDEKMAQYLSYAYSEKYGFLTSCPTNIGTGMRASVMIHLPALSKTGNIAKVLNVVNGFGMNIRGLYGEGTNSKGNIYQISNKQTLSLSEQEITKNLKVITDKVVEQERLARKILEKNSIELEDEIYRAYGLISNCKKISSEEVATLLSEISLGVNLGIIKEINDSQVKRLELYTKPANLQKFIGQTLNSLARDIKRAEIIKEIISKDNE